MGGTPRGKDKPRPSYETGALRDSSLEELQDGDYNPSALRRLIQSATRAEGDTGSNPANRA